MDQPFTSFGHYTNGRSSDRSWFAALTASSGIYVGIIATVMVFRRPEAETTLW